MMNKCIAFFSAALLALAASAAHATPIVIGATDTFTETPYNQAFNGECCFSVTLTQLSTNEIGVDVSLSKLAPSDPTPLWAETNGPHVGFGFNLDTTVSMSAINFPWSTGNETVNTPDGPGKYSDRIDNGWETGTSGYGGPPKTPYGGDLTFDITATSGNLSFADFIDPNSYYFEADILGNNNTGEGYILCDGTVHPPVAPEPSSLMLLGTGMLGAGLLARRRMAAASISA